MAEHNMIKRSAKAVAGTFLVVIGIIVTPLPIPFGVIMIIIGLSLLASSVPWVREYLITLRRRYRDASGRLNQVKNRLPTFARQLIEETDPERS